MDKKKLYSFAKRKSKNQEVYTVVNPSQIDKPIVILVGPNGTGKTKTLEALEKLYKKDETVFVKYSNRDSGKVEALRSPNTKIIFVPTSEEWSPETYDEFIESYQYYLKHRYQDG